jgi:hypothetical protein
MTDTGDTLSRYKMVNGELVRMTDEEYAAELKQREQDAAAAAQEDQTNVNR